MTGELEQAIKHLFGKTATGLDGIPPSLLKHTGKRTQLLMKESLNAVMWTGKVPASWRRSQIQLSGKKGNDKATAPSLTPALHKLFGHILQAHLCPQAHLQDWAVSTKVFEELQNGFCPGRRLEGSLFVVTQATKIIVKGRDLWNLLSWTSHKHATSWNMQGSRPFSKHWT